MKGKVAIFIYVLFVLSMLLSFNLGGVAVAAPETEKAIVLKAVTTYSKTHTITQPMRWLKERVDKRSNGKVTINYLGGPEVIPNTKLFAALKTGVIDLFLCPAGYYRPEVPALGCLVRLVPYTPSEARKRGIIDFWNEIANKEANAFFLSLPQGGSSFNLHLGAAGGRIKHMADMKGLKIRVSPSYEAFTKALGAVPIYMEPGEIYSAVEQGVVDGFGYPDLGLVAYKGIIKYRVVHKFYTNESTMLVNLDTWKSIPKDMQNLMISVVEEIEREIVPLRQKEVETELREHMALGMKLIEFPPDEAKAYVDLAYKAAWEEAKKLIEAGLFARGRKLYGFE